MYLRVPNWVWGGESRALTGAKGGGGGKGSTIQNDSQRNYSDFVFNFCHFKQTVLLSEVKALKR